MAVVCDASPLIALASVGHLHLLRELFDEVHVPPAVWEEVVRGETHGVQSLTSEHWIRVTEAPDDSQLLVLRNEMDPGEAEAIALAVWLAADLILLDEIRARKLAIYLGFRVMGVLGILGEAKAMGLITAIRPLLDRMLALVLFRLKAGLYERTLRACGEWE